MAHGTVIGHGGEGNLEVYDYFCNMCKMRVIGAISTTILLCIFKWPALYTVRKESRKTSLAIANTNYVMLGMCTALQNTIWYKTGSVQNTGPARSPSNTSRKSRGKFSSSQKF